MVIVSTQSGVPVSSYCSNTQMGNLSMNVMFAGVLQEDLLVYYLFPKL